ncbi:MAG: TolC family protein [Phycisphaerales bacterium]|nr:TolC family protein [Phycisphaerales bacterium]
MHKTEKTLIGIFTAGLLVINGCGPGPMAEWDPYAFSPPTPVASWSPEWWPQQQRPKNLQPSPQQEMTPHGLPSNPTLDNVPELIDLTIAADLALLNSPKTRQAWAAARAAAAEYGISRAAWYPTMTAWIQAIYGRQVLGLGGEQNVLQLDQLDTGPGVTATWTVLDFGRREAADDQMKYALIAANYDFNREIQKVLFDVQTHFFTLEAADGLLTAALSDLTLAETVLQGSEEQLLVGLATMPQVLLARQRFALASYEVEQARADVHSSRANLLTAMGLRPDVRIAFELNSETPLPDELPIDLDQLVELAFAMRPDLTAAVAEVRATEAGIQFAEAMLRPQIDFEGMFGLNYAKYHIDDIVTPPADGDYFSPIWSVGVVGSWIFFEGGALDNNVRLARAQHQQALAHLDEIRLDAAGEVWDAFFNYEAATRRYQWSEALLESSQESADAIEASFSVGLSTLPEVLAAQYSLADAQSTRITSRADLLTASAALIYATGDLRSKDGRENRRRNTLGG